MNVPLLIVIAVLLLLVFLFYKVLQLNRKISSRAKELFEQFKTTEVETLRRALNDAAKQEALANLELWKMENEASIRRDAINRSSAIILGKVSEHAVPFHGDFPFNPKDLRFIGSPIDMIVFDGSDENREVTIYFLEIKTGNSRLSNKQVLIKEAVMDNRVFWRELRL